MPDGGSTNHPAPSRDSRLPGPPARCLLPRVSRKRSPAGAPADRHALAAENAALRAEVARRDAIETALAAKRTGLEEALRASELQFRTLADTTSAAILMYDADDRVEYANPATTAITGFALAELQGRSLWDLVHPDFHADIRARRAARARGEPVSARAVMRIVTRTGAERWVDFSVGFATIGGRTISIGTAFDVTGQRQAEAAIRRERDFSSAILNSLPGVFYLYDEQLRFLRWNTNFERVLGYSGAEIAARSPLDLFEGPDRVLLAERIAEVFATGASDVEAEIVTKDGRRVPYYFTGQTTHIDGRLCLIGTGIDVTARRQAEAALRTAQRRLEEAQARARLGSWEIDPHARQGYWSAEMYRLYERDPALGPLSFAEFFTQTHPDDHAQVRAAYRACARDGVSATLEYRAVLPSGGVRWLSGTLDAVRGAGGAIERLAGTVLDVTARRQAEEDRRRLEAALRRNELMAAMGALVGGVAHEVRNPIFGMSATLDALEARVGTRPELAPYLGVLRGELDRLGELMRDLLAYGKPSVETLVPGPLDAVLAAALAGCAAAAAAAGLVLPPPPACGLTVAMEPARLRQVFENLLGNAIHYSPRGATIELSVRAARRDGETWADVTVADRGPGFAPDELPRLFEPFFSRRRGGTGLGLAIVQRIVEAHGGTVSAANRAGGGACLCVYLPCAAAPDEAEESPCPAPAS